MTALHMPSEKTRYWQRGSAKVRSRHLIAKELERPQVKRPVLAKLSCPHCPGSKLILEHCLRPKWGYRLVRICCQECHKPYLYEEMDLRSLERSQVEVLAELYNLRTVVNGVDAG